MPGSRPVHALPFGVAASSVFATIGPFFPTLSNVVYMLYGNGSVPFIRYGRTARPLRLHDLRLKCYGSLEHDKRCPITTISYKQDIYIDLTR